MEGGLSSLLYLYRGVVMNKYKDYIARTQEERILLDILYYLEKIANNYQATDIYDDAQIVEEKIIDEIIKDVKKNTKSKSKSKKKKGDE